MKIPKQITHTAIIACMSMGLLSLVWLNSPSAAEVQTAAQTTPVNYNQDLNALLAPEQKQELIKQNNLHQIEDLLPGGLVLFTDVAGSWQLEHDRFKNMTPTQTEKLKEFFLGKFVTLDGQVENKLSLPMRLYSPVCFANATPEEAANQCPIVLEP